MRARTLHTDGEQRTVAIVLSTGDEAMACLKAFAEREHLYCRAVHGDRGICRCNLGIFRLDNQGIPPQRGRRTG